MLKNFKTVGIKIIYWCLNSLFIFGFANQGAKKWNMTVGMLGALFSCNFSTISVAALCQAVLWVDHSGGGADWNKYELSPQLALHSNSDAGTFELFQLRIWYYWDKRTTAICIQQICTVHLYGVVPMTYDVVHTPNIITFCIHWSFQHQHQRSWCV